MVDNVGCYINQIRAVRVPSSSTGVGRVVPCPCRATPFNHCNSGTTLYHPTITQSPLPKTLFFPAAVPIRVGGIKTSPFRSPSYIIKGGNVRVPLSCPSCPLPRARTACQVTQKHDHFGRKCKDRLAINMKTKRSLYISVHSGTGICSHVGRILFPHFRI